MLYFNCSFNLTGDHRSWGPDQPTNWFTNVTINFFRRVTNIQLTGMPKNGDIVGQNIGALGGEVMQTKVVKKKLYIYFKFV